MSRPPRQLDNADVILWAWSGEQPFGYLRYSDGSICCEVFGQAICQYAGSESYYRFTCDKDWSVEQDSDHDTIEDAKASARQLYGVAESNWLPI